jgi:hypothetical protein
MSDTPITTYVLYHEGVQIANWSEEGRKSRPAFKALIPLKVMAAHSLPISRRARVAEVYGDNGKFAVKLETLPLGELKNKRRRVHPSSNTPKNLAFLIAIRETPQRLAP